MRILIATPQIGHAWGGAGTYVHELVGVLGRSNEVMIITAGSEPVIPGAAEVRAISSAVGVMRTYALFQLSLRRNMPGLVREFRPDAILVNHTEMSDLLCARTGSTPPIVVTAHTLLRTQVKSALEGYLRGNRLDRSEVAVLSLAAALLPLEAAYWRQTRHAIFVSNWIRREILGSLQTNLETSAVIPNGVSAPDRTSHQAIPIPEADAARIVFVGRLLATKGLGVLIQALRLILDLPWECVIIGPGASGSWEARARVMGVDSRIRFLGQLPRPQVLRIMEGSDIFVLPSFSESCPYTLLEAMQSSLAVVASRVGDIPEIVEEGRAGLLFEPGRADTLGQALRTLLLDQTLRRSKGSAARAIIDKRFTAEIMGASTLRALEEMVNASRPQGI